MTDNRDSQAFLVEVEYDEAGMKEKRVSNTVWQTMGMTQRTYIATAAMRGLLSLESIGGSGYPVADVAKASCEYADALLLELSKNTI